MAGSQLSQISTELPRQVLDIAAAAGAAGAEVAIRSGQGMSVTVRNGELETIEHHRDKSLAVTVYVDGGKGSATTTDFDPDSIKKTVAAAAQIAAHGERDEYAGLLEPEYLATEIPDLDLDHGWDYDVEQIKQLALECDRAARAVDDRIEQIDDTSVNSYRGVSAYANSNGFDGRYRASRYGLSCVVVAAENGAMQRGYWYTSARDPADLEHAEAVGARAAQRTVAKLGAVKLTTDKVPVLFEAPVAGGLFGSFVSAVSGGSLYRKASFLLDSKGEQIFPRSVTLSERPHLKKGIGSAPYDGEGGRTSDRELVRDGVVNGYVLSGYSARRLGLTPTGNAGGVHNLLVSHGEQSFDELVRSMGRGLLVTELMGFGVNPVTGDYSRGATGFWVEGGEIAYPVEEITIAGNLKDMYRQIIAIGNDVDRRGNIQCGSVLVEGMTVAGA